MAQKEGVYKATIKQGGYWTYTELYGMIFDWLKDNGYNVNEDSYIEKLSGGGKEIMVSWVAKKKVTDYFAYEIKVDWHILGMNDAEVEIDGKKVKTNKGEVKITFNGSIINDYESRWEDKPFWKFMRSIYEKYVIRETIDEYGGALEDDVRDVIKDTKAFLRIPAR